MKNEHISCRDLKTYIEITRLRRECLAGEVEQLSSILNGLTNSYRVLVDAAEEFNHIAFSSKDDVKDAVDRADDLGELIDEVIDTLGYKLKEYLRDIKKSNICREEFFVFHRKEDSVYHSNNYEAAGEKYNYSEDVISQNEDQ